MKYLALFFVLSAVILGGVMSMSYAEEYTCNGKVATIVGTSGKETIEGTDGDDVIVGLTGGDTIRGWGGNDTICGEGGAKIGGGDGDDWIQTDLNESSYVWGGPGEDICYLPSLDRSGGCEEIILIENPNNQEIGEEVMAITIGTDKSLYNLGEDIIITGTIDPILENIPVFVEVIDADSVVVKNFRFDIVRLDGGFGEIITDELPAGDYIVRAVDIQNEVAESTFTVSASTPPSDTFTTSNLTMRDRDTGNILGDIQTKDIVRVVATVNNDKATETTYFYTVDINDPDFGGGVAFSKTIGSVTTDDTIFATWSPLKAGTYTIILSIFDNERDLNPLITPLQLSVVVAGEDKLTFDNLVIVVRDLEARIAVLEGNN